jgi:hypothetical protein
VRITGAVHGKRAVLEIQLTFLASPHRWVRAAVGLPNAVLSKFEMSPEGAVQFDDKDGFVVWLPPSPPKPAPDASVNEDAAPPEAMMPTMPSLQTVERQVTLHVSIPVVENGAERRLPVRVPRAPAVHWDVSVDMAEAQAGFLGSEALAASQPGPTGGSRIQA